LGAERELAVLEHAVGRALSGDGGVTALSGEPGIGKTTLAHAIGITVAQRGVPVLWGRGVESAPVYWPWLQVLRGHQQLESISGYAVDAALSARVHALTGGNPLFVSELGRLLAEDVAAGTPVDDAWPHEVPATVRALLRRRMGRLEPSTRAVLHAAAVVGREFPVAVVAAMVRAPAMSCLDELEAGQAARLVETQRRARPAALCACPSVLSG
jgi:predicted ATPase